MPIRKDDYFCEIFIEKSCQKFANLSQDIAVVRQVLFMHVFYVNISVFLRMHSSFRRAEISIFGGGIFPGGRLVFYFCWRNYLYISII